MDCRSEKVVTLTYRIMSYKERNIKISNDYQYEKAVLKQMNKANNIYTFGTFGSLVSLGINTILMLILIIGCAFNNLILPIWLKILIMILAFISIFVGGICLLILENHDIYTNDIVTKKAQIVSDLKREIDDNEKQIKDDYTVLQQFYNDYAKQNVCLKGEYHND